MDDRRRMSRRFSIARHHFDARIKRCIDKMPSAEIKKMEVPTLSDYFCRPRSYIVVIVERAKGGAFHNAREKGEFSRPCNGRSSPLAEHDLRASEIAAGANAEIRSPLLDKAFDFGIAAAAEEPVIGKIGPAWHDEKPRLGAPRASDHLIGPKAFDFPIGKSPEHPLGLAEALRPRPFIRVNENFSHMPKKQLYLLFNSICGSMVSNYDQ